MELGLSEKRVLITGASRGIGASIAKLYISEGAYVTIVARNEDHLKKIIQSSVNKKNEAKNDYIVANLREIGMPSFVANEAIKRHGKIDIVIHNVGGALGRKDIFSDVSNWLDVWNFNLGIAIEMNNILVPKMIASKWGRVIHISSISAEVGEPLVEPYGGAIPYAVAKAGLNAYIKGMGRELASKNIVVSGLMPGAILTKDKYWDKVLKSDPEMAKGFLSQYYPSGRFGNPEEVAGFAVFLGSELASFAAGSIIPISGGRV